jgi:ABC-2 type transport system ATP-binding protein
MSQQEPKYINVFKLGRIEDMLEVKNLSKEFKLNKKYEGLSGTFKAFFSKEHTIKRAVDDLSFQVNDGEMVGYIGLNGAGKSTTIKMLTGLMVPTSGECVVNGYIPHKDRKMYTKNIGVVFGNRSQLWWDLPVAESYSVLQRIYEIPEKQFKERLGYLKGVLDINDFYLTPVRNLSLGQKMRADLVASLLHNPAVLFLDEPTIGLDILVKDKIRKALRKINEETQTTVMLTTHDLDDIEAVCDRIIVIDKGKKIFDGKLDELKNSYGKTRMVALDASEDTVLNFNEVEGLNKDYISAEKAEQGKWLVKFDKDNILLPELMQHIVTNYTVKDFTVIEPQLEDIIKEIYRD